MHSGDPVIFSPDNFNWKGLTLTASAAHHIVTLMAKDPHIKGIRLGVKQSGCAGLGYTLALVTEPDSNDLLYTQDGARLYVPVKAMPFIDGTEVDYVHVGLSQIFKFNNPKADRACGCGESFGIDD